MKWFKHETDSIQSEKLNWLIDNHGMEGYGRWFRLLEVVAERMDGSDRCYAEYSIQKWASFLFGKPFKIVLFLKQIENKMEIKLEQNGNILKITIPKLLERRDNYSKNLQATDKKLASKELELEVEVEKKKNNSPAPPTGFAEFWEAYPKKVGKPAAQKAWKGIRCDPAIIFHSLKAFVFSPDPQFIPHPATWLNQRRWEDQPPERKPKWTQGDPFKEREEQKWKDYREMSREDYLKKYPEEASVQKAIRYPAVSVAK